MLSGGSWTGVDSMASETDRDSDRDDSVFADCPSGYDSASGARKRQMSVPEMVRQVQKKRAKRQLSGRKSRSPPERGQPRGAGTGGAAPAQSEVTLQAIQQLIEAGNTRIIEALEARFVQQERRIEILEAECHEKDATIRQVSQEMLSQRREIEDLREKIDGIDMNRRMSSLILTCDDFGQRRPGEDIEMMTVRVLNKRFPDLKLTTADIQAAHRLQDRGKVIAKFVKRDVRDRLFERRFELAGRRVGAVRPGTDRRGAPGDQQMAPLYLNESLVPELQRWYNELLLARKPGSGARVASVFTRRGYVFCRKERGGENIRIRDQRHLQQIIRGGPPVPPAAVTAAGVPSGGPFAPPARVIPAGVPGPGPPGRAAGRPVGAGRGAGRPDVGRPGLGRPGSAERRSRGGAAGGPELAGQQTEALAPGMDTTVSDAVSETRDRGVCAQPGPVVAGAAGDPATAVTGSAPAAPDAGATPTPETAPVGQPKPGSLGCAAGL